MRNTEVKLTNAESTWPEAAREDRKLLIKEKTLTNVSVFFICRGFLSGRVTRDSRRTSFEAYRTFRVGFYTDEVRHCLVSSVFYLFSKKIKGGQNELVKSPKMIAMTALIRVISF